MDLDCAYDRYLETKPEPKLSFEEWKKETFSPVLEILSKSGLIKEVENKENDCDGSCGCGCHDIE